MFARVADEDGRDYGQDEHPEHSPRHVDYVHRAHFQEGHNEARDRKPNSPQNARQTGCVEVGPALGEHEHEVVAQGDAHNGDGDHIEDGVVVDDLADPRQPQEVNVIEVLE